MKLIKIYLIYNHLIMFSLCGSLLQAQGLFDDLDDSLEQETFENFLRVSSEKNTVRTSDPGLNRSNINNKDANGYTFLHRAAENGHIKDIQSLIELGAYINAQNRWGETPLHVAASKDQIISIETLIALEADLEIKNDDGETPLFAAILGENLAAVQTLIKLGANIAAQNKEGINVLVYARENGLEEIVQALKDIEFDFNKQDNKGDTLWHFAVKKDDKKFMKILKELGASLEIQNAEGASPLNLAVQAENLSAIRTLVRLGADINAVNMCKNTPVHVAVLSSCVHSMEVLNSLGANFEMQNQDGNTPLHIAIELGNTQIINFLLALKPNLAVRNKAGKTPYMIGLNQKHMYQALLHKDINNLIENGLTYLIIAAREGDIDKMRSLLEQGASLNTLDSKGRTALYHANAKGQCEASRFLMLESANRALIVAAKNGFVELLKLQLKAGAHVDYVDMQGCTAIYYSAEKGCVDAVEYLMNQGASLQYIDPNSSRFLFTILENYRPSLLKLFEALFIANLKTHELNELGQTLWHSAATYTDAKVMQFLVEQLEKSEVEQEHVTVPPGCLALMTQDSNGQIALHAAAQNTDFEVFNILIKAYINNGRQDGLAVLDRDGESAVHKAAYRGYERILELCEEYQVLGFTSANRHKRTPLMIALAAGHPQNVIKRIQDNIPATSTPCSTPKIILPMVSTRPSVKAHVNVTSFYNVPSVNTIQTSVDDAGNNDDDEQIGGLPNIHNMQYVEYILDVFNNFKN